MAEGGPNSEVRALVSKRVVGLMGADAASLSCPERRGTGHGFRDMLEDLGSGLGVTDPVSGQAVAKLAAPKVAKKKKALARSKSKRTPAKKAASKTPARTKRKRAPAKKTASKR